jgi:hypothetical protein
MTYYLFGAEHFVMNLTMLLMYIMLSRVARCV